MAVGPTGWVKLLELSAGLKMILWLNPDSSLLFHNQILMVVLGELQVLVVCIYYLTIYKNQLLIKSESEQL
jgi:hypothetical protein